MHCCRAERIYQFDRCHKVYEVKQSNLGKVNPSVAACGSPSDVFVGETGVPRTWYLLLGVQILIITIAKPGHEIEHMCDTCSPCTYWSVPTRFPDLALPMYCICLHHSRKPDRRIAPKVRARDIQDFRRSTSRSKRFVRGFFISTTST